MKCILLILARKIQIRARFFSGPKYMPIQNGKDKNGPFYRWGFTGAKYYYLPGNVKSRENARARTMKQARAIEMHKRAKK